MSKKKLSTKEPLSGMETVLQEQPLWKQVEGLWKPLYGGFAEQGVSIEWHDFRVSDPLIWSESFHPNSLEVCLNYTGTAQLREGGKLHHLGNEQVAVYTTRDQFPHAVRNADSMHRFLTLELSVDFLRGQFAAVLDGLQPGVRRFLENPEKLNPWLELSSLPTPLLSVRAGLLEPPVHQAALPVWYQGKILEILSLILFRPDQPNELFCERHKRLNRERIERVRYLLQRDLENPPSLDMLAKEVECSPFYLSRLFAEETGVSLPKYLRLMRVEKAAELISENGMSVTDAAMAVGYSSLSAFHKAFVERHGVSPSQFGSKKKRK